VTAGASDASRNCADLNRLIDPSQEEALMAEVASWPFEKRLEEAITRCLPKLGPEARTQLAALITPEAIAVIAGVLIAWVVSHAFAVGEIIDVIILAVGVVSVGLAVFTGLDHLHDFAVGTYRAHTEQDLDAAADHLAKAIGILGIQAVLAVLFRGAKPPQTFRGTRPHPGSPPPRTPGWRYKPTTTTTPLGLNVHAYTTFYGNIRISPNLTGAQRAVALRHEQVHQALAPKLYLLRNFRIDNRLRSYFNSSLWRFLEEALAQVYGTRQFVGVRFPVKTGYVFLRKGGGFSPDMKGKGVLPEAMSLLHVGILGGVSYQLWFSPTRPANMNVEFLDAPAGVQ
jgi:hypothetical protein